MKEKLQYLGMMSKPIAAAIAEPEGEVRRLGTIRTTTFKEPRCGK
jgi:hypothetical protein